MVFKLMRATFNIEALNLRPRISMPRPLTFTHMLCQDYFMTYRLPSLNSLRAFEAAARHLSFRTAATEIGVTSGAISQQVRKLEQSLGVDLFRRLPHGLLLTREGLRSA